jgi:hypothetical protein
MGALPVPDFLKDRFQPESILRQRPRARNEQPSSKQMSEYDSEEEKIMNIIGE